MILTGKPVDWTYATFDSDPFVEVKKAGHSAFNQLEDTRVVGKAFFVEDRLYSIAFIKEGKSYQAFYDGHAFAQRTPTTSDNGAERGPDYVEISSSSAVGDLHGLSLAVSGYHFSPMRIPQLRSCFGNADQSISLAEFIHLLNDERIQKTYRIIEGNHTVSFKAFVEQKEAGTVTYVFAADGFLKSLSWQAGENWSASETIEYSGQVMLESVVLPSEVGFTDWANGSLTRYTFKEWNFAGVSDLGFAIPEGSIVNDHLNQLSYTNTGGAANEARAARLYAMQNALSLPDIVAPTPSRLGRGVLTVFAVLLLLIVISYVVKHCRNTSRGNVAKILVFLILSLKFLSFLHADIRSQTSSPETGNTYVNWVPGNGWVLKNQIPGMSHISQCGSQVAMLSLILCNREFDPLYIAKELKPDRQGISMLRIRDVIASHGIKVRAKSQLTFDDVVNLAKKNEWLIVHVPQYQRFSQIEPHYVLVLQNSNGEVIFLDPPHKPLAATQITPDKCSQLKGMTALLCNREANREPSWSAVEDTVLVAPDSFKNDVFSYLIRLRNDGEIPIVIVSAQVSCRCIQLEFNATRLAPKATEEFPVRIERRQWGTGKQTVRFIDAFGSEKTIVFSGSSDSESSLGSGVGSSPPVRFVGSIVIPAEMTDSDYRYSFRVELNDSIRSDLEWKDFPEGVSASINLNNDRTEVLGELSLSSEFIREASRCLPKFLNGTLVSEGRTVTLLNCRVVRDSKCSIDIQFLDSSRCRLLCRVDSQNGWKFDSCSFSNLEFVECDYTDEKSCSIVLEKRAPTDATKGFTSIGVVRFSNPKYLPFEKVVSVRWPE